MKEIYLAGGCFWGSEEFLGLIPGVVSTEVGYANGNTQNPSYEDVCRRNTGHAETVKVVYDENQLPLPFLLDIFYQSIDPSSLNRQGPDTGTQYRSGIYYVDPADAPVVKKSLQKLAAETKKPVVVEALPLQNYSPAEEYHQKYLKKNPGGYCHLPQQAFALAKNARVNPDKYKKIPAKDLENTLSLRQLEVTQHSGTEPAFQNEYWDNHEKGIYVDITSGEPLFISADKFDSGCGWPSFSRPIDPMVLREVKDLSHGMIRTEVRSRVGNAHLGHVFDDGPKESGGTRYCINSAALRFIPATQMEEQGYGEFLPLLN